MNAPSEPGTYYPPPLLRGLPGRRRRIIAIQADSQHSLVFALCNDGSLWRVGASIAERCIDIPQPGEEER